MKPKKKISVSDLRAEAQRLVATGKMPTFEQLAEAIASSPAAQELFKMKLRSITPEAKS
jgi:hypothetical protein